MGLIKKTKGIKTTVGELLDQSQAQQARIEMKKKVVAKSSVTPSLGYPTSATNHPGSVTTATLGSTWTQGTTQPYYPTHGTLTTTTPYTGTTPYIHMGSGGGGAGSGGGGGGGVWMVQPTPPNYTEFGEAFSLSSALLDTPEWEMLMIKQVMDSYQKAKLDNFPSWKGFPSIKHQWEITGESTISWYALVPKEFIYDVKVEESLWDE